MREILECTARREVRPSLVLAAMSGFRPCLLPSLALRVKAALLGL
jgi:hypothetical protein